MEPAKVGTDAAAKAASVPSTDALWHLYCHKLRTWAPLGDAPAGGGGDDDAEVSLELVRPYLLLLVCVGDGAFLSCAAADGSAQTNVLTTAEPPSCDDVVDFICRVMAEPRVLNASMRNTKCVSHLSHCMRTALRLSKPLCSRLRSALARIRASAALLLHPARAMTWRCVYTHTMAVPYLCALSRHLRRRSPGRPARISFAHTASAGALRGTPELWPDADVCPYVLGCRAALEPLGVRTAFAPMPRQLLDTVVRQQIEAAFNPPEADWGTRLLPGTHPCLHPLIPCFF
jgi:hypothetical protein